MLQCEETRGWSGAVAGSKTRGIGRLHHNNNHQHHDDDDHHHPHHHDLDHDHHFQGLLLNSPGGVQHWCVRLQGRALQQRHRVSLINRLKNMDSWSTPTLQEVHLCDRRPVHHGPWLPDTLGPPICPSTGGQKNLSRADEDRFQQTHKNFSQKKTRCDHRKKNWSISEMLPSNYYLRLSKSRLVGAFLLPRTVIDPMPGFL